MRELRAAELDRDRRFAENRRNRVGTRFVRFGELPFESRHFFFGEIVSCEVTGEICGDSLFVQYEVRLPRDGWHWPKDLARLEGRSCGCQDDRFRLGISELSHTLSDGIFS